MLQSYLNTYKKFPNYAVALHLCDLSSEFIKSADIKEVKRKEILYDVTQFVLGGPITGIQRVVKAFLEQSVTPVVFYDGNYYRFVENKIVPKRVYVSWTRLINFISKNTYVFFSNTNSSVLQLIRNYRKRLTLSTLNVDYKKPLSLTEIEGSNIFISDLPASREHLEFLMVLNHFTKSRISIFLHDLIPITHPELMPKSSTNEFNLYGKLLIGVDEIFVSTKNVFLAYKNYRKIFTDFNANQKIYVKSFPNFQKNEFENEIELKLSKKEQSILNSDKPFILSVGTVFTRKNYSLVFRALQKMNEKKIQCDFIIAAHKNWGDSALDFAIRQFTDRGNKLFILYGLSDMKLKEFYDKAALVAFPSLAEGFGLPIIEARSYGKLVLVNKIEPMLSFSRTDSGVIAVDPNSNAWAEMIELILEGNFPLKLKSVANNTESKHKDYLNWCSEIINMIHNG
jgi:glycosyltransferase involved in cell wall biosynthesis